jgi:hypothetical protein
MGNKRILILILIFQCFSSFGQVCKDSILFIQYKSLDYSTTSEGSGGLRVGKLYLDKAGNYYIEGSPKDVTVKANVLTKFNSLNQPIWSKYYVRENGNNAIQAVGGWPQAIDTFANIYGNRYYRTGMASPIHYQAITKFDSSGNFIWGKLLNRRVNPAENWGFSTNNTITKSGTQFYYTSSAGQNYMTSIGVNNGGIIVYNQTYRPLPTDIRGIIPHYNALINDSTLLLFFQVTTNNNLRYYKLLKINVNNNTIQLQKTFWYYQNNLAKNNLNYKCYYNHQTQKFTIVNFSFNSPTSQSYFISTFNDNFEAINTVSYRRNGLTSTPSIDIFENDNIILNFKHGYPTFPYPSYTVYQVINFTRFSKLL